MDCTSRLPSFYKLSQAQRRTAVQQATGLSEAQVRLLEASTGCLGAERLEAMVENAVGVMQVPLGIATNFLVNNKDYLIPMATEEPSVIAASSFAAKLARETGGFVVHTDEPIMVGQIVMLGVDDYTKAAALIEQHKPLLIALAHCKDAVLCARGGGIRDLVCRHVMTTRGAMMVVELVVDVRDAMGANIVNTFAEAIAGQLERMFDATVRLRIVSNLATRRLATARAVWKRSLLGADTVEGIVDAYAYAQADPYRCATHNKGVMNGVDAVALATGNDCRALEAGAHAYASRDGQYQPLTQYRVTKDGDLEGVLMMPLAVGILGGSIATNPLAQASLAIIGVTTSMELAGVMAAVGLAQNLAALRALVDEGIQRGHMRLHGKNIALQAGVPIEHAIAVAHEMVADGDISVSRAQQIWMRMKERL